MHDAPRGTLSEKDGFPVVTGDRSLEVLRDQHSAVPANVLARVAGSGAARGKKLGDYRPALHAYTVFMALSILVLICSGGLVTSNDAGLAVPDWPTSFGYNMFAFPLSRWLAPGGVRLEHSHRLIATAEGVLTIVLALWAWRSEPRRWVRGLAYGTLGAVIFQGMLGGIRVAYRLDWIGVIHGCFAQAFFAYTAFLALVTSRWWIRLSVPDDRRPPAEVLATLSKRLLLVVGLIYLQLGLGATMRHVHAGLSIPDFPKAYGQWWPHVTPATLPAINLERTEVLHIPPTTLAQIHLQMTHRINAMLVLAALVAVAWEARRRRANLPRSLRLLANVGVALVTVQITLGIYTIWTKKAADVATAHVATGAILFVWSVLTYAALRRWTQTERRLIGSVANAAWKQPVEAFAR